MSWGLCFSGPYAIVGLSRTRENRSFAGLDLDGNLRSRDAEARCGVQVIDLRTGDTVHWLRIEGSVDELYDVVVLEVGADDYLAKPFSFRELLARIQAMLRRVQLDRQVPQSQHVAMGQLSMHPVARRVYKGDQEVQLSAREFDLLAILMKNAGRAMNRDELIKLVWGDDWVGDPRTLDVHVRWLRLKIEEDPASPQFIQTVRGYGYRFAGQEELA